MGRIRVLPDQVANKIAAGEVVERPASVVKELLENALDAGSTEVRIEVEAGGRRLIRVADNGCGMLRDDALLAFERHATSKLRDVKDLLAIATLGFRGEALPSIASVSRLQLETRSPEEDTGTRIEIAGGRLLRCDEAALPGGTSITVRDLFFNVPARRKFLRTEQTELAHVASLATHYSLAHHDKSFELWSDGGELLRVTPAGTLKERVYQVFGSQVVEDLVEMTGAEKHLAIPADRDGNEPERRVFHLRGFLSQPQVQKANRNSIYIFVNSRLIRDRLLMHAITAAYHNLIPPGSFPFALLFLECDCEEVDVNVHPSKTEVRFRHQSFVHDFVRDAMREQLLESRPAPVFSPPPSPQRAAALPYSEFTQMLIDQASAPAMPEPVLRESPPPAPRLDFSAPPIEVKPLRLRVPDTHGAFPADAIPASGASLESLVDLRPLGQIRESFIVASAADGLWIIDQHVAHERILFEQILKERAAGRIEVQALLLPIVIQLTPEQQVRYARIEEELRACGFDTEPFGNRTVAIKAAPAACSAADLETVLFEILENAEPEARSMSMDDIRRAIAASLACRAAIKINTRLDQTKMEWLLRELAATDYPMSCPHGRPIALRYGMHEILKAFHRI